MVICVVSGKWYSSPASVSKWAPPQSTCVRAWWVANTTEPHNETDNRYGGWQGCIDTQRRPGVSYNFTRRPKSVPLSTNVFLCHSDLQRLLHRQTWGNKQYGWGHTTVWTDNLGFQDFPSQTLKALNSRIAWRPFFDCLDLSRPIPMHIDLNSPP